MVVVDDFKGYLMEGIEIANLIKGLLEDIEGWTGKVYVYIPNLKDDNKYLKALVDDDTRRVDAWFIRRSNIRSRKYGEAPKSIPVGYRWKTHIFTIRGFQSVYDAGEIEDATSEVDFQERCDKIEEKLARSMSLGITTHDVILGGLNMAIDYDSLGKALCHTATINLTVEERVCTTYEQ